MPGRPLRAASRLPPGAVWSGEAVTIDETTAGLHLTPSMRAAVEPVLRRVPGQVRSWRRVEAVLEAAEEMLERDGYEEVLQNGAGLCAAAGIPTGTFYTYFQNTEVVLECIRLLWTERMYGFADGIYATPCRSWQEVADRIVDATVEFYGHQATRELWLTHQLSEPARQAELRANAYFGARMRTEVQRLGYAFTGDQYDELVLIELSDRLSRFAFDYGGTELPHPSLVDRARRATRAYLGTLVLATEALDNAPAPRA